jgi:hypothetical protein
VQNVFNSGPYNGKGNIMSFFSAHAKNENHTSERCPPPWGDKRLSNIFRNSVDFLQNRQLFSGFESVNAYKAWFSSTFFQDALDATGFFLTRYSLPEKDVLFGDKQVLFVLPNAAITAFRRCNQIGLICRKSQLNHIPIQRFLSVTNIPVEISEL